MKELLKSKKNKTIMLAIICVLVIASAIGTLALLRSQTTAMTNSFALGNVTTEITEDFEKTNDATTFTKKPVVTNIGENNCYVRVRVVASPEEDLEITGVDLTNWIKEDGYYYYKYELKAPSNDGTVPGESTTPLFTTVSVKDSAKDTIEEFEVSVYQEAVQSTMNARDGSSTSDMDEIWAAYDAKRIPDSFE